MIERDSELLPAPSCADCKIGPHTIYGPTAKIDPGKIYACRSEVRRVPRRRILFSDGEIPDVVYTILSGWCFNYKELSDGRRQILGFLIPGDTVPLQVLYAPDVRLSYSVRTATDTILCSFQPKKLSALLTAPKLQKESLTRSVEAHLDSKSRRLVSLGRRSASARLAQLLLELEGRMGRRQLLKEGFFELPVSQECLADALGLTTTYVNRTMQAFRKKGWIVVDQSNIKISEHDALTATVNET